MQNFMQSIVASCFILLGMTTNSTARIIASSLDHYTLHQEAISSDTPDAIWERLIHPARWWHPDHSFSGNAENLTLEPIAGGFWREQWDGGSVAHGRVLYVKDGEQLRLNAPFGPLQEMAVTVIWTITITQHGTGSKIVFEEIANGTTKSNLIEIAPAVDFVKTEAINRLAGELR